MSDDDHDECRSQEEAKRILLRAREQYHKLLSSRLIDQRVEVVVILAAKVRDGTLEIDVGVSTHCEQCTSQYLDEAHRMLSEADERPKNLC